MMRIDPEKSARVALVLWIVVGGLVFVFAAAALSGQT
jgi:hypothetical protein